MRVPANKKNWGPVRGRRECGAPASGRPQGEETARDGYSREFLGQETEQRDRREGGREGGAVVTAGQDMD